LPDSLESIPACSQEKGTPLNVGFILRKFTNPTEQFREDRDRLSLCPCAKTNVCTAWKAMVIVMVINNNPSQAFLVLFSCSANFKMLEKTNV